MILLVCLVLTLWPAGAWGAMGTLSPNRPPWLGDTSGTSATGSLPNTGADLPGIALTGVVLLAAGAALRVRVTRRGL